MAARNRVQYHPPPPISYCEGPRIIQKLKDVVVQILELPLYISILFGTNRQPPVTLDWLVSGIIGKPTVSTYLAIDFKICNLSL